MSTDNPQALLRQASAKDIVFIDGDCGLCQRLVVFLWRRDPSESLAFAPLGGQTFEAVIPHTTIPAPQSVVVRTTDGRVLRQSDAVVYLLGRLESPWRWIAGVLGLVPRPVRDVFYRIVAKVRHLAWRSRACDVDSPGKRPLLLP